MKKVATKSVGSNDMRIEYNFKGGVRGKHYKAMQDGYILTIRKPDGSTVVKEVKPRKGTVVLEPDVQPFFPDSQSVNTVLRSLIRLLPVKRKTDTRKARGLGAQRRIGLGTRSRSARNRGR